MCLKSQHLTHSDTSKFMAMFIAMHVLNILKLYYGGGSENDLARCAAPSTIP
jgi:hypothetical protein